MKKTFASSKCLPALGMAMSFVLVLSACLPGLRAATQPPVIQTVIVTNQVQVTVEVTREVTRIVEIPVTITPTFTPTDTPTPQASPTATIRPTSTGTPQPASATVLIHTQCLYGPDPAYIDRYDLLANSQQAVVGRNLDASWVMLQGGDHKYPCWVKSSLINVTIGSLLDQPVTQPDLTPYSTLYTPPQEVSTYRSGSDVTIFWNPIPMTEADYHGYLIEAWVCNSGNLVFTPLAYDTSFDKNSTMLAIKVTDEPGCTSPSSAHIYTVNNQGYSIWKNVPWQGFPTPTATP